MPQNGLREFKKVIADYKSVSSYAITGTTAIPLVDFLLKMGPSWLPGVPVITPLAQLIALICVFHFWFGASQRRLKRRMTATLIALSLGFCGYTVLYLHFTFINPASSKRDSKGFVLRPDTEALIPDHFRDADEVLENSQYDSHEVWQPWSITAVEISLLLCWLLFFGSLSTFIGTFIVAQRKVKSIAARKKKIKKDKGAETENRLPVSDNGR